MFQLYPTLLGFQKPVKVTDQITAWRASDVQAWSKNPATYVATDEGAAS